MSSTQTLSRTHESESNSLKIEETHYLDSQVLSIS